MLTMRDFTVAEFRGSFPQIAPAESVQLDALTKGDDDPFYVTLPVAVVGATSNNGLHYDEALVAAIQEQMVGRGGLMGHLETEERDTAFPIEAADWIGAIRQGETLWGKAYIPPGEAREYIRRLKARGGQLATSIYGPYAERTEASDGSWKAEGFQLESLDLAPADRAALKLGGEFGITAQMSQSNEEVDKVTKEEILAQLQLGDIPPALVEKIVADYKAGADTETQITELTASRDAEKKLVKELQDRITAHDGAQFDAALDKQIAETVDWKVEGEDAKKRVALVCATLRSQVLSEMADDRDASRIEEMVKTAWKSEDVQLLAETVKAALGGPRAIVGSRQRDSGKLEDTPEARRKARQQTGI